MLQFSVDGPHHKRTTTNLFRDATTSRVEYGALQTSNLSSTFGVLYYVSGPDHNETASSPPLDTGFVEYSVDSYSPRSVGDA